MDAITLLKQDHRAVEQLFEQFEHATDDTKKKELVERIMEELSKHAAVEEQAVYPAARDKAKEMADTVLESLEEHHLVKVTLAELEKMLPSAARYAAKVKVLQENVRHHVEEEENELFPALEKALSTDELNELGDTIEKLKATAPTRPHPLAPDEPPFNMVNQVAGIADKAVQTGKQVVGKALGAIRGS